MKWHFLYFRAQFDARKSSMTLWFRTKRLCDPRCYSNITTKWQVVSYMLRIDLSENYLRICFLGVFPCESMPAWVINFNCCGKWMNWSMKILDKWKSVFHLWIKNMKEIILLNILLQSSSWRKKRIQPLNLLLSNEVRFK